MVLNFKEIPPKPIGQLNSEELRYELAVALEKQQTIEYAGGLMADFLQISKETYFEMLVSTPANKKKLLDEIVKRSHRDEESVAQYNLMMENLVAILPSLQSIDKYY